MLLKARDHICLLYYIIIEIDKHLKQLDLESIACKKLLVGGGCSGGLESGILWIV